MFDQGLATVKQTADIRKWIEGQLYMPHY
jgi:hypothetical protein